MLTPRGAEALALAPIIRHVLCLTVRLTCLLGTLFTGFKSVRSERLILKTPRMNQILTFSLMGVLSM